MSFKGNERRRASVVFYVVAVDCVRYHTPSTDVQRWTDCSSLLCRKNTAKEGAPNGAVGTPPSELSVNTRCGQMTFSWGVIGLRKSVQGGCDILCATYVRILISRSDGCRPRIGSTTDAPWAIYKARCCAVVGFRNPSSGFHSFRTTRTFSHVTRRICSEKYQKKTGTSRVNFVVPSLLIYCCTEVLPGG